MAVENPRVSRPVTPAADAPIGASALSQAPASPPAVSPGSYDPKKFSSITSTRTAGPRSILSRPVGNVGEINAGGVRGTPNDLVDRVLEHEPPMQLLEAALH